MKDMLAWKDLAKNSWLLNQVKFCVSGYWEGESAQRGTLKSAHWSFEFLTETELWMGFPGGASGKEPACQGRRLKRWGCDPWIRKIPWRRKWQPTPVFLPGEFHGQRGLVGYRTWGCKELDATEVTWHTSMHQLSMCQARLTSCVAECGSRNEICTEIKRSHTSKIWKFQFSQNGKKWLSNLDINYRPKKKWCSGIKECALEKGTSPRTKEKFSPGLLQQSIVVQLLSCIHPFLTSWTAALQASLSFTVSWSLLKLMSIESVMSSSHLILCCPLLLLPWMFPSIRFFSIELALCIRWPKDWSFSFSISPSNEYSGLISFRVDWMDLLAVQRTVKSLLQHHSWKASVLWCSAFFYWPALTVIYDYWKNHSFDYTDICRQSNVSAF